MLTIEQEEAKYAKGAKRTISRYDDQEARIYAGAATRKNQNKKGCGAISCQRIDDENAMDKPQKAGQE